MSAERLEISEQPTIEIEYGKRTFGFHREPHMSKHDYGYIAVDWSPGQEQPQIVYYVVNTRLSSLHFLEVENSFDTWVENKTEFPQVLGKKTAIKPKWTGILNPATGEMGVLSKGPNDAMVDLRIKAKPILIENPPREELGL